MYIPAGTYSRPSTAEGEDGWRIMADAGGWVRSVVCMTRLAQGSARAKAATEPGRSQATATTATTRRATRRRRLRRPEEPRLEDITAFTSTTYVGRRAGKGAEKISEKENAQGP